MESDPRDLDGLQKTLNESAKSAATLWTAFIIFLLPTTV
jgi:hypothetical protein